MFTYRITKLLLNDGTALSPGSLVVIVGPNNAGKSRALRDIATICAPNPNVVARPLIVKEVTSTTPVSTDEVGERKKLYIRDEPNGQRFLRTLDPNLAGERNFPVTGWGNEIFNNILHNPQQFGLFFGSQFVAHLSTQTRLQLVQQSQSPQFRLHTSNLLQTLYWSGKETERRIREIIRAQFGVDIALDFSSLSQLVFRVGKDLSSIPEDPRDAAAILDNCERLDDQGDGLRSFVGITTALECADRDVFLIDEPEAFLHPPQAFRMGQILADKANEQRQVFVATHSADVLQGVLARASGATILRMDRLEDQNRFRVLDQEDLKTISKDPLLQSARVLDGIFYPTALVVEADADARFYQAALSKAAPSLDIDTVNAQNKQTVARIRSMYKKLGIRSVGLVDFDVLNDPGEFRTHLQALGLDGAALEDLLRLRERIARYVQERPIGVRIAEVISRLRIPRKVITDSSRS